MKQIYLSFLIVFALVPTSQVLAAPGGGGGGSGFIIAPFGLVLQSASSDDGTTKVTSSGSEMDFHFGYEMSSGLYLGVVYDIISSKTTTEPPGTTVDSQFSAYGPGLGYKDGGFFVMLHYLTEPRSELESGSKTTHSGGTGYQLDIGYAFMLSSSFRLGLDYRYISANYKKRDASGTITTVDIKATDGDFIGALMFEL